jgi:ParB-like chromosome segregation protein Spo0J
LPIHQRDREDRAGLDADVEQVRTTAQPVLGDQQVAGRGDRQELGDALDDAKDDDAEQIVLGRGASAKSRARVRGQAAGAQRSRCAARSGAGAANGARPSSGAVACTMLASTGVAPATGNAAAGPSASSGPWPSHRAARAHYNSRILRFEEGVPPQTIIEVPTW